MGKLMQPTSDRRARRGRCDRRRAAAMVEMALILPVLILLVFAVMEYGWMFIRASQVSGAARHGVRVAIRPAATQTEVQDAVALIMQQAGFNEGSFQVEIGGLNSTTGGEVTVEVTLPYDQVSLTNFPLLPVPDVLRASATMAKEGP
ncbi:TadE/TadG family type IV pilus assembly protein [Fontivita pretiosa]|uniref:TadE/TadG family type IV pilus assembly protein n=1 Tax=Fontivita pretiosa TaxID=2989684 RepID=UPI003D16EAAE